MRTSPRWLQRWLYRLCHHAVLHARQQRFTLSQREARAHPFRAMMCTGAYTDEIMEPVKVGIREFRERLASYVLESDAPVAITRHGDTVGYFIPARRKRSEAERAALKEAAAQLDALLAAKGLTEDDLVAEFKSRRKAKRR